MALTFALCLVGVKREKMKNERRKREINVIFHYLVRVKKESKDNKMDRVFHSSPFFSHQIGKKR